MLPNELMVLAPVRHVRWRGGEGGRAWTIMERVWRPWNRRRADRHNSHRRGRRAFPEPVLSLLCRILRRPPIGGLWLHSRYLSRLYLRLETPVRTSGGRIARPPVDCSPRNIIISMHSPAADPRHLIFSFRF